MIKAIPHLFLGSQMHGKSKVTKKANDEYMTI